MRAFGYPESLVREYAHWVVLVRPKQVTKGALVMVCREDARSFGAISAGAFAEHERVIRDIERGLKAFCGFDKINHLMLMMVDKEVHYHVLPRYAEGKTFEGVDFPDPGWPAAPYLGAGPVLQGDRLAAMVEGIKACWPE